MTRDTDCISSGTEIFRLRTTSCNASKISMYRGSVTAVAAVTKCVEELPSSFVQAIGALRDQFAIILVLC